jgi:hypothetical protein
MKPWLAGLAASLGLAAVACAAVEPELPTRDATPAGESGPPGGEALQVAVEPLDVPPPSAEEIAAMETATEEIPGRYWPAYFDERPREFLLDPQGLLSPINHRERLAFLKDHSGDSAIDLFVYVFKGSQGIPGAVRDEELVERFFSTGRPAAIVYYFMGEAQRSMLRLSPTLAGSVPLAEQRRALESSVMQAVRKGDPSGQIEAFLVQMSIRIYWMERMLDKGVEKSAPPPAWVGTTKRPDKKWILMEKLRMLSAKGRPLAVPVAVLAGALVAALGLNFGLRRRARYRFPEHEVETRLGGAHGAGVGAVISFASAAVPPASQRDQVAGPARRV